METPSNPALMIYIESITKLVLQHNKANISGYFYFNVNHVCTLLFEELSKKLNADKVATFEIIRKKWKCQFI